MTARDELVQFIAVLKGLVAVGGGRVTADGIALLERALADRDELAVEVERLKDVLKYVRDHGGTQTALAKVCAALEKEG